MNKIILYYFLQKQFSKLARFLSSSLQKLYHAFINFKNYIDGDFAYQKYLDHHNRENQKEKALDKKAFIKKRQIKKWNKISRCC